jgi:hypothetical protein
MGGSKFGYSSSQAPGETEEQEGVLSMADPVAVWVVGGSKAGLSIIRVSKITTAKGHVVFDVGECDAVSKDTTVHGNIMQLKQLAATSDGDATPHQQPWQWTGEVGPAVVAKGHMLVRVDPALQPAAFADCRVPTTFQFSHDQLELLAQQTRTLAESDGSNAPSCGSSSSTKGFLPYESSQGKVVFGQVSEGGPSSKLECLVCKARGHPGVYLNPEVMRIHIAKHILVKHVVSSACGFCGQGDCLPQLSKGKGGNKQNPFWQVPEGACKRYYYHLKYKSAADSKECSNVPVFCPEPECSKQPRALWKYAMEEHYAVKHAGKAVPKDLVIQDGEKKHVLKHRKVAS